MDEQTRLELKGMYPRLNDKQLDLISERAYEVGHPFGQDEVNIDARSIADFVNKILEAGLTPKS